LGLGQASRALPPRVRNEDQFGDLKFSLEGIAAQHPELRVLQITNVMHRIVATARNAGSLVHTKCGKEIGTRRMDGPSSIRACTGVATQAFTVVVGLIELDAFRSWRGLEMVHVDMLQPAEHCLHSPKHRVVGVARIVSLFGRNAVILEMRCGQMPRIVGCRSRVEMAK
jgi:hypothetical protein